MNQLVYAVTAIVALPFAALLFLACLSEIEALRAWIKERAQSTTLEKKPEGQAIPV
jgi:hypothetical protein